MFSMSISLSLTHTHCFIEFLNFVLNDVSMHHERNHHHQIDKYDVDAEKAVDRISRQLLEHNIMTESYGGEVPIVPVSKNM